MRDDPDDTGKNGKELGGTSRTSAADATYAELKAARRAALKLMEDAAAARRRADELVEELRAEVESRRRAEEALRVGEERQAFLLKLSDTLRAVSDPREMQQAAARLVVEHLGVGQGGAYYLEVGDDGDSIVLTSGWWNGEPLDLPAGSRISEFGGGFAETYRERRSVVYADVERDPRFDASARAAYRSMNVRAGVGVPLWKGERLVALFGVTDAAPREWAADEVQLVGEVAERTWAASVWARAEQSAREYDRRLRVAVDATRLGVWEWDLDSNLVAWNDQHYHLMGMPPGSGTVGAHEFFGRVHPDDRPELEDEIRAAVREGRVFDAFFRVVQDTGLVRWMSGYGRMTEYDGERPKTMSGVMRDITDRMRMEEQLSESGERLRLLIESATDVSIFTTDPNGVVNSWNTGSERIYGFREDEIIGQDVAVLFTEEDRSRHEHTREMQEALRNGRALDERWHRRKDGSVFFASGLTQPIGDGSEGFVKIARDMTDRLRAERSKREKERMETLVHAQEMERKRIALDLHDELGQQLTALRLKLDRVGQDAPEPLAAQIDEVKRIARSIDEGIDFLAWELRPAALDDLGLIPALEKYVKEWSAYAQIEAELAATSAPARFQPEIETALYRIVQEGLNNVHKHAGASKAQVTLRQRDGKIVLTIDDDGVGFDPGDAAARTRGIGLIGMNERVQLIGGTMDIESEIGRGTTLFIKAPIGPLAR